MSRFFARTRPRWGAAVAAAFALAAFAAPARALLPESTHTLAPSDVIGTVTDSASGQPLANAAISVMQGTTVIANSSSDEFGRFTVHNLNPGAYVVAVHFIGFRPATQPITVTGDGAPMRVTFAMVAAAITLQAVQVQSSVPVAVDTRTGDQTFQQDNYHGAPTNTTSEILQQSIVGAARAPDGRGAHSRPARRVHVLRGRRAGAAGHLGQSQRAVRPAGGEQHRLPDRRVGRRVRRAQRRHHQRSRPRSPPAGSTPTCRPTPARSPVRRAA